MDKLYSNIKIHQTQYPRHASPWSWWLSFTIVLLEGAYTGIKYELQGGRITVHADVQKARGHVHKGFPRS